MPRQDGRIEPGQPLSQAISARAWNKAMDAADRVIGTQGTNADPHGVQGWPRDWVWARNYTGTDLPRFSAVELSGELIDGNQALIDKTKSNPVFAALVPNSRAPWSNSAGMADVGLAGYGDAFNGAPPPARWGIAVEPIPSLAIGKVAISGIVPAYLDIGPGFIAQCDPIAGPNSTAAIKVLEGFVPPHYTWLPMLYSSLYGQTAPVLQGNLRVTVANGSTTAVVDVVGEADVLAWGGAIGGGIAGGPRGWGVIRFAAPSAPSLLAGSYTGTWAQGAMTKVTVLSPGYYDPPEVRAFNPFQTISTTGASATTASVSVACVNNRWQLVSVPPKA